MTQTQFYTQKEIKNNNHLLINLVFAFFPISFILGSLIVNINLFLLCCIGIYHLKSKILNIKLDFPLKIIFLLFLLIFFSTSINFAKTLYMEGLVGINTIPSCYSTNCFSSLTKLTKSILFLRFFIFLLIVYLTNKFGILNFKYFFLTASFAVILVSLDIIYQYIFGFNIIGLKSHTGFYNSSFFGNELIAGGYVQRFSFFAIFFTIFTLRDKKYTKFFFTIILISVLCTGILFSGNRMPLILFLFGLILILLSNLKIKKILLTSIITLLLLVKFITLIDKDFKYYVENYSWTSFVGQAKTMLNITGIQKWKKTKIVEGEDSVKSKTSFYEVKFEGSHKRIYLAAIDTWKMNNTFVKIFGNGIKSFREDCWKLESQPDIYLGEDLYPGKKNRLCANHPHNYYLEILTETGIVGLIFAIIIAFSLAIFIFKNYKFFKEISINNFILLSAIISLILETVPLKSTGSLFSTNNATYLTLISSIVLSHKTLLKIDNLK